MKDFPLTNRQEPEIAGNGPGMDLPLWLLQKDDSRSLYLCFLLSVAVHILLFIVMAATRIFHPFAGASRHFDLVWLSPAPASAPMETSAPKAASAERVKTAVAKAPSVKTESLPAPATKTKTEPPPPAAKKAPPTDKPPTAPAITPPKPLPTEAPPDEPAEMVIPRYGGKVVDIVEHKEDIPTFTVMSSVKLKSMTARAVVHTIRETEKKPRKLREKKPETIPLKLDTAASPAKEKPAVIQDKSVAVATSPVKAPGGEQGKVGEKTLPIQGSPTSAKKTGTTKQTVAYPSVNRSINSFAAALSSLSSAAGKLSENAPSGPAPGSKAAGSEKTASLGNSGRETNGSDKSSAARTPAGESSSKAPARGEAPEPSKAEKPAPQEPEKPQLVLHPPLVGDLKLVITGDVDLKVETFFRPYPKNRRGKPFTRRESENRRSVPPKMVRTEKNVHEAAVEIAEEGIYTIMVQSDNAKPVTAEFVLKIRESRPGAVTKKLGSKTINSTTEVARVLMPEGILWNDDSYFSGNMEDSDSVTKFHSGSGLMWREYK